MVLASTARGWPPQRYLGQGIAFVVTSMTARHHREVTYGEELVARTWMRDFRRGILSKRQVELWAGDELVAECTQQWAHVGPDLRPTRADPSLAEVFPRDDTRAPVVSLDAVSESFEGGSRSFTFTAWQTAMDPLGHANHPDYLAWCDEGVARAAVGHMDPQDLAPVGERVAWKGAVLAGDEVTVETWMAGLTEQGDSVLRHRIGRYAKATTVRRGDLRVLFEGD